MDALLAALADTEERARRDAHTSASRADARARLLAAVASLDGAELGTMKTALARPEAFILDRLNPLLGPAVARRALDLTHADGRPIVWPDVTDIGAALFAHLRPLVGEDIADLVRQQLALGSLLWSELCES